MINFSNQYSEMRKSLIEIIFNNTDMINPNLNDFMGYINSIDYDGTLGDDIPREYKDPIIVTKIENNEVYGHPAVDGSVYYDTELIYDINDFTIETLLNLVKIIG